MKKLSLLLILFAALAATSCSSGYDEKTCDDLIEKYDDKGKLNTEDLAEAISQCGAIGNEYDSRLNDIMSRFESDDESEQEKALDDYYELLYKSDLARHDRKLYDILEKTDLKGDNKKAYKELQRQIKSKQREWKKIHRKAEKLTKKLDYEVDWQDLMSDYNEAMEAIPEEPAIVEEEVVAVEPDYDYDYTYAK